MPRIAATSVQLALQIGCATAFRNQERDVIVLFLWAESLHLLEYSTQKSGSRQRLVTTQSGGQSLLAEFATFLVERFGHAICIEC